MSSPRSAPVLVFDGDCAICSTLSRFVGRRIRRRDDDFVIAAWQDLDLTELGLTEQQVIDALQWVTPAGRIASGADAVAAVLMAGHVWWRPFGAVIRLPLVNQLAAVIYRWVAANRDRLPGGTPACAMPPSSRAS